MSSFSAYASRILSAADATTPRRPDPRIESPFAHDPASDAAAIEHHLDPSPQVPTLERSLLTGATRNARAPPSAERGGGGGRRQLQKNRSRHQHPKIRTYGGADDDDDDDDQGEEEEEEDAELYRDDRGRLAADLAVSAASSSASVVAAAARDDPFLRDPDIADADDERGHGGGGGGEPPHQAGRPRGASALDKARGWMAVAGSSASIGSAVRQHPARPSAGGRWARNAFLPEDVYSEPRADEEVAPAPSRSARRSGRRTVRSHGIDAEDQGGDARDPYDSSGSDSAASSSSSSASAQDRHAGSAVNSPFLASSTRSSTASSSASSSSSFTPPGMPGAFQGRTSRKVAADIYSYPHPPARSGWTPFAPGNRLGWREYKDKSGLVAWAGLTLGTLIVAGWMAMGAETAKRPSTPSTRPSPYYTLTRSIPVLFVLTLLSVAGSAAHVMLLRHFSALGGPRVLRGALVAVPAALTLGWAWAFGGSFIYDDEEWSGGLWSTVGLRVISLLPLLCAGYFARAMWMRRDGLVRSLQVLELGAKILAAHPALLLLALAQLGVFLALTLPILTIFVRLFLVGHFGRPGTTTAWETDTRAKWLAWATLGVWLWTWAALSGVQRVTVAGVVSHWYFHREDDEEAAAIAAHRAAAAAAAARDGRNGDDGSLAGLAAHSDDDLAAHMAGPAPGDWLVRDDDDEASFPKRPSSNEVVRAAFGRATGSALGTVFLSALVLSLARLGAVVATTMRRLSRALSSRRTPVWMQPIAHLAALLAGTSVVVRGLSDYALVYVGVTGEGFGAAARKASRLVRRNGVGSVASGLVIHLVLDLTTLALSFLAGVAGFLFSAHNLHVPADAPLVGLLCALVPYWTLRLCADVLRNATDSLFLCFAIDESCGEEHCKEAVDAFTGEDRALTAEA